MEARRVDGLWAHIHWLGVLGALGSYTAAAQRLGVSKAAMSQRIADLERAAGVPLVRRTTRSVRLTEAGQQLADSTRDAYAQIERELAHVKDLAAAPRGLLRVTAPVALGRQQIVPRLAGFLREVPEVRVELVLTDQLVSLAQEGFDLAIRHTARPPETHVAWTLCETRSCLVASADYLARRGRPEHPRELAADLGLHDCLPYARPGETPTWQFQPLAGSADEASASTPPLTMAVRGPFSANNSEALREAAIDGLGIALLPDFSAQSALRAGTLQTLLPDWRPVGSFGESLFAIRPYSPYVPRAVHALVAFLRQSLKDGFKP
ncbi:LysR family transcriptional regulator [Leptothrix discophora]|uniref:LysR family transcriptional regulator n=1 Tax=Leptothrix discophora TaxID=89 RepID=A0ABT9G4C4_LEPDI|nr:LysR family transcriptional regulator [Leptothrix discophora]MDP4301038.1 LysR family transcriptional regulator [Leptothrix discophora]